MINADFINYEAGIPLVHDLFGLCQSMYTNQKHLVQNGYSAFMPYQEWVDDMCRTHRVLDQHRSVEIEGAKAIFHNINSDLPVAGKTVPQRYLSEFDPDIYDIESGMPRDPFDDLHARLRNTDRENYMLVMNNIYHGQQSCLEKELGLVRDDPDFHDVHKRHNRYNRTDRLGFISGYAACKLSEIGFVYSEKRSRRNAAVLERQISDNWALQWSHFSDTNFHRSGSTQNMPGHHYPFLEPELLICHRTVRGKFKKNTSDGIGMGKALKIPYGIFVESFFRGYHIFFEYDLLALGIRAHASLVKELLPELDRVIPLHFQP